MTLQKIAKQNTGRSHSHISPGARVSVRRWTGPVQLGTLIEITSGGDFRTVKLDSTGEHLSTMRCMVSPANENICE